MSKQSVRFALLAGLVSASFALSGCIQFVEPTGLLFSSTKSTANHPTNTDTGDDGKAIGPKTGESCSNTILYLIGLGDSSLKSAAKDGGIKNVHTVDSKNMAILGGAYAQKCTIVTGK